MKPSNTLPYLPEGREILSVPLENEWMQQAKYVAQTQSLDPQHPTGAVVVKEGLLLGKGANGSAYHEQFGCKRKELGIPTGEGYELCEGCHPKNHAEQKAIQNVKKNGHTPEGADLYLWGHWWCCHSCWAEMIRSKIYRVFLMEGAENFFKK